MRDAQGVIEPPSSPRAGLSARRLLPPNADATLCPEPPLGVDAVASPLTRASALT